MFTHKLNEQEKPGINTTIKGLKRVTTLDWKYSHTNQEFYYKSSRTNYVLSGDTKRLIHAEIVGKLKEVIKSKIENSNFPESFLSDGNMTWKLNEAGEEVYGLYSSKKHDGFSIKADHVSNFLQEVIPDFYKIVIEAETNAEESSTYDTLVSKFDEPEEIPTYYETLISKLDPGANPNPQVVSESPIQLGGITRR